jgi:SAM-dependent methyltransferase
MPKIEPFEKHAARYDEWFERNQLAYQAELGAVKSLLPATGMGMEIGVGTGRFAAPLGLRIGVEPSRAMARFARQRGILVVQAVAEALPFMDGTFDFALIVTTLCFLDDEGRSFGEANRTLRRGGSLVVGFIDRESPLGRTYQRRKETSAFYAAARFFSVPEVVSTMRAAGFEGFDFAQTIFQNREGLGRRQSVREGFGEGSFVGVRGRKRSGEKEGESPKCVC